MKKKYEPKKAPVKQNNPPTQSDDGEYADDDFEQEEVINDRMIETPQDEDMEPQRPL